MVLPFRFAPRQDWYNHAVIPDAGDTICAIATPAGRGGIGVVRVSGPRAFDIVDAVSSRPRRRSCRDRRGHTLHRAWIVGPDGERIDDVLLAVFHAPKSYTGDDVVEISAHGGPIPLRRILQRLYDAGARPANPGEFTQRAFLNGKMDLAQAEAVADIIEAETESAHRLAQSQQAGRLSAAVGRIRESVLGVLARIEASIDFPEDVGELDTAACRGDITAAVDSIQALLATADAGILHREGIKIVLAGLPNVGKSSLLNALLRADRAIVTPIPGTTRDIIEESANLQGIRVRFVDTAGTRATNDPVERIGIERSEAAAQTADIAVIVIDAAAKRSSEEVRLIESVHGIPHLVVWNKWDLVGERPVPTGGLVISAVTGWNLAALEEAIVALATSGEIYSSDGSAAVVTHTRHRHALSTARERLADAVATIDAALPADFISIDVRGALSALGEITGETATDDIINEIFSRFCIGK